jgi:hypothetical protein
MTDSEMRIAIAEASGWTNIENTHTMAGIWKGYPPTGAIIGKKEVLPDYPNDLNAMHEAMQVISLSKADEWNKNLYVAVFKDSEVTPDQLTDAELTYALNNAPARQRAESFLKTIGKWK